MGNAANVLRALAKETRVPVVLLSQLRRPQDINTRPTMLDFKESGDIEAHVNTALLLYMPVGEDGKFFGEEEIIIGKQRWGAIGSVPVYYDTRSLSFRDRTRVATRVSLPGLLTVHQLTDTVNYALELPSPKRERISVLVVYSWTIKYRARAERWAERCLMSHGKQPSLPPGLWRFIGKR
jgi:hypothetical protein